MFVFMPTTEQIAKLVPSIENVLANWHGQDISFDFKTCEIKFDDFFYPSFSTLVLFTPMSDYNGILNDDGTINRTAFITHAAKEITRNIGTIITESVEDEALLSDTNDKVWTEMDSMLK